VKLAISGGKGRIDRTLSDPLVRSWKYRLITTVLVVLGSIGILFPAWLPDNPRLPTEESAVEGLQVALLLISAAFWFGAARPAGDHGSFYKIMGTLALAGAFGEGDTLFEDTTQIPVEYVFGVLAVYALFLFLKSRKHFGSFITELTSHPAAGFIASAFMMIYVLARFLGTKVLWQATLGDKFHRDIPDTVQGYLELLACYLLLVGTLGLCLSPRNLDPTND